MPGHERGAHKRGGGSATLWPAILAAIPFSAGLPLKSISSDDDHKEQGPTELCAGRG